MKLSDAEWQLMDALWSCAPASAREVINKLPGENNWAYTTVKTMLTRLVQKKAVAETKNGNTSIYLPLLNQQTARNSALHNLVDKVLGGTIEPLMHFLVEEKKLSTEQRQELIEILNNMDQTQEGNSNDSN